MHRSSFVTRAYNHGIHGTHGKAAWLLGLQFRVFGVFRGSMIGCFG